MRTRRKNNHSKREASLPATALSVPWVRCTQNTQDLENKYKISNSKYIFQNYKKLQKKHKKYANANIAVLVPI